MFKALWQELSVMSRGKRGKQRILDGLQDVIMTSSQPSTSVRRPCQPLKSQDAAIFRRKFYNLPMLMTKPPPRDVATQ